MTAATLPLSARMKALPRGAVWGLSGFGVVALWLLANVLLPAGAPLGIVVTGIVLGTVTALLAMGLILIYRTDNIINFAYGSMGGVGGVLAVTLYLSAHLPYPLAALIGLAAGLLVGGLVEVLVVRRFKNASRLVLTVATIGLAQVLGAIQLFIPAMFKSSGLVGGFTTPLSGLGTSIGPVRFTGDHILIVAVVPPVILVLAWFLLKTDSGAAVRAAAENRERALLLGIPIHKLSTLVWIIAGGLAAMTAILKAPFSGSVSTALGGPTLLLPALAAATVAKMESLPRAFWAGIGLGILDQVVFWNTQKASTMDVAFLVVILVALLTQKNVLSRAQASGGANWSLAGVVRPIPAELRRLPEIRAARIAFPAVLFAFALLLPHLVDPSDRLLLAVACVWGMVGISLVVLTGWGGAISLGQFAIVGMGAVLTGNLLNRTGLDLFVILLLAGFTGAAIALLLGLPALRIKGLFLAVTTLAFAVALDSYFLSTTNFPKYIPGRIQRPILWQRFPLDSGIAMYYLTLVVLVLTMIAAYGVRRGRTGRALVATKDNERAAAASALPTTTLKLTGFLFSGVIAGVAGGLYVLVVRGVGNGSFLPSMSLEVFSTAVIGGLGSIGGALFGVTLFRFLSRVLSGEMRMLVSGAGLLFVLLVLPGGLGQAAVSLRDRLLRLVADRRGILVPSLVADKRAEETEGEDRPADETALLAGALDDERLDDREEVSV
ncbi:MAG TPA: ABC transporter permease [Acidimicrobiales bacterium]|nr:ABC transporter permease [Acidimicrobiales bacterium]